MCLKNMTLSALVASVLLCLPGTSDAQFGIGIGRGYGGSYYGGGYGLGRYGPGFGGGLLGGYGRGISIGIGNRWNGLYSTPYSNYGNYDHSYYNAAPGAIYTQPSVSINPGYQSFYPPTTDGVNQARFQNGTASIVVTAPANAELWWNGLRITQTGATRRFRTAPLGADGSMQTFQARWTGADGQQATRTREVRVTPNSNASVDFTHPAGNGAEPVIK